MVQPVAGACGRVRHLGPELVKFGIAGGLGTIIDLVFTYLGSPSPGRHRKR